MEVYQNGVSFQSVLQHAEMVLKKENELVLIQFLVAQEKGVMGKCQKLSSVTYANAKVCLNNKFLLYFFILKHRTSKK